MRVRFVIAAVSCIAQIAIAQPQQPAGKVDAKALMQSGIKLFEAKDYLGALAVFTDAYKRFPSAKILLNIGTTEALLERKADAANSYQRYLDAPDADPAKKSDVAAQIAELDKAAGLLQLEITPDDAEVLLDDEWVLAKSVHSWRVVPGAYTIKVRKSGYQPDQKQDAIQGGAKAKVSIALVKLPEPEKQIIVVPAEDRPIIPEAPRSRIGAVVFAHVSVLPKIGSAVFIGGTADVTEQLAIDATLILGPGLVNAMGTATLPPPRFGAYAGAKFAFLTGNVRPLASAGVPIFFDDGARLFMRVAGGVEYIANRNLSFLIEVGGEYGLNPRDDIRNFALVPSLGAAGRL